MEITLYFTGTSRQAALAGRCWDDCGQASAYAATCGEEIYSITTWLDLSDLVLVD